MDYAKESLRLHYEWKGKLEMTPRASVDSKEALSLAYTPGVAQPCLEIQKDVSKSYELTRRWNTVAVVTDGSAVLGLGHIGPEAGMPVMEGKCVLFKAFGGVDAIPLCVRSQNVDDIVNTVALLAGSFGGVNLEDISAPRCFEIEKKLKECCDIPIFHDDQHGTAVITLAGVINALKVVGKKIEDIKIVTSGAGAAGIAIIKLLISMGLKNVIMTDRQGAIYEGREGLNPIKEEMAKKTPLSQIAILYRTNQGPRQLIAALMAYNIPFYMQDAVPNLFDHWISKNIIDYMHLAMGDRKRSTFLRVMNRPKRYISREYLTESQVSFDDLLEKVKDKPWLYEYVEDFKEDLRIMKNMTPLMAINYIRKSVGYNAYLAEYARFRKIQEEEFTQVLEELQESAKGYDTYEAWFDHIKEYTEELNRQSKENQKEKEGVVVSTMHSTKGLEFERVFLPDVNEDVIPHKKSMKEEDVEEERRLFYVGVTRAKKYLHILSVKKLYNKDSRPSRFVEELRSRQEKRGVLHGK